MANTINGIDVMHDYRVRILFSKKATDIFETEREARQNINNWNDTCAKAIELFGLPGEKYTCRFTKEAIEFWFLAEQDALMFELCCG